MNFIGCMFDGCLTPFMVVGDAFLVTTPSHVWRTDVSYPASMVFQEAHRDTFVTKRVSGG